MRYLNYLKKIKAQGNNFFNKFKSIIKLFMPPEYFSAIMDKYRYKIKYKLRKYLYYGDNYICPCCRRYIRKFAPFGILKIPNRECPFCYVMERHRLVFLYLINKTNFFSEKLKILDFGPEHYIQKIFKSIPNLDYISADINPECAMVQMDITNILYEDNYFDFLMCIHVLEHVKDDQKAMSELFRVLKPGGWAILNSPIDTKLDVTVEKLSIKIDKTSKKKFIHDDHAREYGKDYKERLEKIGFIVDIVDYKNQLSPDKIRNYGLMNCNEDLYLGLKPKQTSIDKSKISLFNRLDY